MGDRLWRAIDALPSGSGIVFRHHDTLAEERVELAKRVAEASRQRNLTLAISRDIGLARALDAALVHNPAGDPGASPFSRSAHSLEQARAANEAGASLIFLSPIQMTRSHPGRLSMPDEEVRRILALLEVPCIALGGMNRERFARIEQDGFYGWAGIDAWLGT